MSCCRGTSLRTSTGWLAVGGVAGSSLKPRPRRSARVKLGLAAARATGALAAVDVPGWGSSDRAAEWVQSSRRADEHLHRAETNLENYRLSAGGFLAEIHRMNLEVREYLRLHASEVAAGAPGAG